MKSKLNRIRTIAAAAALSAAVSFATPAFGLVSLAATGTVTGSDINVRSEASSSSSQVGTVTTGDTVTVGETATDDSGATWYQVTLSNGTTGYVRGDFLTVSEDETSSEEAPAEETEASTEATTEDTDEAAANAAQAAEQDSGEPTLESCDFDPVRFQREWYDYKRTQEILPVQLRPHPHEFELYFDI